jgi:hypothetical protein
MRRACALNRLFGSAEFRFAQILRIQRTAAVFANEAAFIASSTVSIVPTLQCAIATFCGARCTQTTFQANVIGTAIVGGAVFGTRIARLGQKLRGKEANAHRFAGARGQAAAFDRTITTRLRNVTRARAFKVAVNVGLATITHLLAAGRGTHGEKGGYETKFGEGRQHIRRFSPG